MDSTGSSSSNVPVALVTGAAGEIGRALVRRLAADGYAVVGTDLTADAPEELAERVALWCAGDAASTTDMGRVVARAVSELGRLDVLVVNAGVTAFGPLDSTAPEVFTKVLDINVTGAVRITQAALPSLRLARGTVVVISSVAGFAPVAGRPAYTASKHAVTGLFESVRHELERDGVQLTMVYPSFLATSPTDLNAADGPAADRPVSGAMSSADEVAGAVVDGVRRGRARVWPSRMSRQAYHLSRLMPGVYRRIMLRRLT